jgi:hypothetical protein
MIRLSGRMTPRVIASRSSATFLPEKSSGVREAAVDAAAAAPSPALRAPFCAVCWRPRALPPAFAARLRAGLLVDDPLDRALDVERRPLEPDRALLPELRDELVLDLRAADPDPREVALDFRAPDPDDLREAPPLDALLRDEPPPLPPVVSAMALLLRSVARYPLGARRTISCRTRP